MPYPSVELLTAAATDLKDRHPLTVITIPALLRGAQESGAAPTDLQTFGSRQEYVVLDAFKVHEGPKPYLAVWGDPPQLVNRDYPGSTLQRLRTQDILGRSILRDNKTETKKRSKFALSDEAGAQLTTRNYPKVNKLSLAVWLARDHDFDTLEAFVAWFDETYPTRGTDLDKFFIEDTASAVSLVDSPLVEKQPTNELILQHFDIAPSEEPAIAHPPPATQSSQHEEGEGLTWTHEVCSYPLPEADTEAITERVLEDLHARHIELPDAQQLVHRCVVALLVGHLVLKGPPGTGKTTLARALARGFRSYLMETTATSDWSPFHVVGGLRPNPSGGLSPVPGKVTDAAKTCAQIIQETDIDIAEPGLPLDEFPEKEGIETRFQSAWLFIDEFNRADIDKAIGSLFTVLSSCDSDHLAKTPIELWFEPQSNAQYLWVPARFRIIAAMNDLDTSFVNMISQGLARRFQFITVPAPTVQGTEAEPVTSELEKAFAGAYDWLKRTYGSTLPIPSYEKLRTELEEPLGLLQQGVDGLRHPASGVGWKLGTAQIVDVLRVVLLQAATLKCNKDFHTILDFAIADRIVPQMAGISDEQVESFTSLWKELEFEAASETLSHLVNPHEADLL